VHVVVVVVLEEFVVTVPFIVLVVDPVVATLMVGSHPAGR
jgi:hypothetical protein